MDKRYDHLTNEKTAQDRWEQEQTYLAQNNPGQIYSIDTPPPTVSGSLHIGHIFSYTQTDIIARYKRMRGFSVFYPFGFDDNGLPTERYVEKKLKVRAHQMPRSEFIALCIEETKKAGETFKSLWQRMGLSVDWNACYSTISDHARKISQESFIRLLKDDKVYRRFEPALYCTTCRTSVAQAELDDIQEPSLFNDIVFADEQGKDLVIGTTRPELLPSCVALLYNPNDERYQHLKGTRATVPLFGFSVPVLADEAVSIEKGTGLVMCCTFGDKTDIEWFKKFKLPYKESVGKDGKWTEDTGFLAELKTTAARKKVLEELANKNLLVRQRPISHTVNVHERCKKKIEFIALPQWFLRILDHKEQFLQLADTINWYPQFMKARYRDWVQNLSWDWGLSRQRFFGIPFPVWHCADCSAHLVPDVDQLPIDPQETAFPGGICTECASSNIAPDTDVMDTWNTSSLTPQLLFNYAYPDAASPFTDKQAAEFIPMSMRPQAHDIIRTWAFYTIVKSWMHHKTIPWKDIVISGHVLSDKNEKLSKSKKNAAMAPEALLQRFSADAIRYWTASGTLGHDTAFSESQLKVGQKLTTKLWNAFRFLREHIQTFDATTPPTDLGLINEWILHKASGTYTEYTNYFEQHEFSLALQAVEKLFWAQFCDNYLELVKDQLFNPDNYTPEQVNATRWTLHHMGLRILQLYAPYVPHVTETLYNTVYKNTIGTASLHQTRFAEVQYEYTYPQSSQIAEGLLNIVAKVRKLKTEQQLSLKTELSSLTIATNNELLHTVIQNNGVLLKGVTRAQSIDIVATEAQEALVGSENNYRATVVINIQ